MKCTICTPETLLRYFHPAGPISPWAKTLDLEGDKDTPRNDKGDLNSPDFSIKDATYVDEKEKV